MVDQKGGIIGSVLALINDASFKNPDYLIYRTLNAPKHIAEVVQDIEDLEYIKDTLPQDLQKIVDDEKAVLLKALLSTTSIKNATIVTLTTTKSEIKVSDPRIKRGILPMAARGEQSNF